MSSTGKTLLFSFALAAASISILAFNLFSSGADRQEKLVQILPDLPTFSMSGAETVSNNNLIFKKTLKAEAPTGVSLNSTYKPKDFTLAATFDYNNDSYSDLIWQKNDAIVIWQMQQNRIKDVSGVDYLENFKLLNVFDLNQDKKMDTVWIDDSFLVIKYSDNLIKWEKPLGWRILGVGIGEKKDELTILLEKDGLVLVQTSSVNQDSLIFTKSKWLETNINLTLAEKVADFNADGYLDIWQEDKIHLTNESAIIGSLSAPAKNLFSGDFNNDKIVDLACENIGFYYGNGFYRNTWSVKSQFGDCAAL
jgi:hypothetical protein